MKKKISLFALSLVFACICMGSLSCDLFNGPVDALSAKTPYQRVQLIKPSESVLRIKDSVTITFLCDSSLTDVDIKVRVGASGTYTSIPKVGTTSGGRGKYTWLIDSLGSGTDRNLPFDATGRSNIRISDNFRNDSLSFDTCATPFSIIAR